MIKKNNRKLQDSSAQMLSPHKKSWQEEGSPVSPPRVAFSDQVFIHQEPYEDRYGEWIIDILFI